MSMWNNSHRMRDDGSGLLRNNGMPTAMSTSSSYNSLSPSSPGDPHPRPGKLQLPSPGGGLIPDPVTSPMQQNKRSGLKISFSQPNLRKHAGQLKFPAAGYEAPQEKFLIYNQVQSTGRLKLSAGEEYEFCAEDLVDRGEIGRGNFGAVNKMLFRKAGRIMAVKRIR